MAAPHETQREPGKTMDSPAGRRTMTTLRKLPQTAPKAAAKPYANHAGSRARFMATRPIAGERYRVVRGKTQRASVTFGLVSRPIRPSGRAEIRVLANEETA